MTAGRLSGLGAEVIVISPEMTVLLGAATPGPKAMAPKDALEIAFCGHDGAAPSTLHVTPAAACDRDALAERRLTLLASRTVIARLGGAALLAESGGFHLTTGLREVTIAILNPTVPQGARSTYRAAKAIELLCETLKRHAEGELLPLASDGGLSAADTRRVIVARRLIDERCGEKLTLDSIARLCGLNRSKLTRGFRELFDCSVAEALAERRLELASRMLLTTDLPVSCVGYETGYLNNASFARAFGRRFGRTPSDYRAGALAAAA